MKFKKIVILALVVIMTFILCSCVDMEVGIILNKDGTVRVYEDLMVSKETLDSLDITSDKLFEQMDENEEDMSDWISEKTTKMIDGREYIGERIYRDISLEELSEFNESKLSDSGNITYDIINTQKGLKSYMTVNIILTSEKKENIEDSKIGEYLSSNTMNLKFRIDAPFEIYESNGSLDNGTVFWNITDVYTKGDTTKTLTVTYLTSDYTNIAIIIGSLVALVVIIIFVITIIKKKNQKANI